MNQNKSKEILLSIIGIVILVIAIAGVSFSLFNYAGVGTRVNKVNIAKMTFLYKEDEKLGNGISLNNALPISDLEGETSSDYFDFTVTANAKEAPITYDIVVSEDVTSNLDNSVIKIFLVSVENDIETTIINPKKFIELTNYDLTVDDNTDKLLLNIPSVDIDNYTKNYRLRIWIDDDTVLYEEKDGQVISDLTNKMFAIKINIYARNIETIK